MLVGVAQRRVVVGRSGRRNVCRPTAAALGARFVRLVFRFVASRFVIVHVDSYRSFVPARFRPVFPADASADAPASGTAGHAVAVVVAAR